LALSDPCGITCSPLEVVEEPDDERLLLRIVEVAEERGAGEIVVGIPRPLAGGTNQQMEGVLAFVRLLEERAGPRVVTWDERFTSKLAERKGPRTRPQDAVAACYMLQSYLDSRANARGDT
jgi:putative Holliday junction resolvase